MTTKTISLGTKKGIGVPKNYFWPPNPQKIDFLGSKKNKFSQKTRLLRFDQTLGVVPQVALVSQIPSDPLTQFKK